MGKIPASTHNRDRLRIADKASDWRWRLPSWCVDARYCPYSLVVLLLIILPVLPVFRPSALLILPVPVAFRTTVLQYSQYSQYERYSILYWVSVRCLLCNAAAGMYMAYAFKWDKTKASRSCLYSDAVADIEYGHAVPQLQHTSVPQLKCRSCCYSGWSLSAPGKNATEIIYQRHSLFAAAWVLAARGESEASLCGRQPSGHQCWVHRWATEYPTVRTLVCFDPWYVRHFQTLLAVPHSTL